MLIILRYFPFTLIVDSNISANMLNIIATCSLGAIVIIVILEYLITSRNRQYIAFKKLEGPTLYLPLLGNTFEAVICSQGNNLKYFSPGILLNLLKINKL